MPRSAKDTTDWLAPALRAWVAEHGAALDAIVAALEHEGAWPDPVELERGLRAQGDHASVLAAVTSMPRVLGWRDHSPSRVTLTLFGLACVPRARPLLEALLSTMRLALARFDDPAVPAILSRADVEAELGLNNDAMDVLSLVLLGPGSFFMAGGDANLDGWQLAIDERVVLYQDVDGVDGLIRRLADERLTSPPLALAPATADVHARLTVEEHNGLQSVLVVAAAVLGLGADAAGFVLAPLWLGVGLTAGVVTAISLHRSLTASPPRVWPFVAVIVAMLTAGGVVAAVEDRKGSPPPSVSAQITTIKRAAHKDHRRVVFQATSALRGPGHADSQVLVLRDDRIPDPPPGDAVTDEKGRFIIPRSDELRIYDLTRGRLREAFRFLPQGAGQIRQLPEGDSPQFHFAAQRPTDVDGDGRPELIGAFERVTLATAPLPAPVVVAWDDGTRRYRLTPLVTHSPGLNARDRFQRAEFKAYTAPTRIVDRYTGQRVNAYATDMYGIVTSRPYAILVAGYNDIDMEAKQPERYALQAWTMDLEGGTAETSSCFRTPVILTGHAQGEPIDALMTWFRKHPPPGCEP